MLNRKMAMISVLMAGSIFSANAADIVSYKVGVYEVSLLVERQNEGNMGILIGADDAMKAKYFPTGVIPFQINAFLIKTPTQAIMVDTGFGTNIFDNIKSLGVPAEKIDTVLLTHMHGDHIGGLQKDGKATFPNATIYVAAQEKAYWLPANAKPLNDGAEKAFAPYGSKIKTFNPVAIGTKGQEIFPGITALAAFGHTPGHTVFLVQSEGKSLLIAGDIAHVMDIQIPVPEISVTYDVDPVMARESRKKVFEYVSKNKIPITGMHLLSPGIGFLEAQTGGGYKFSAVK